MPQHTRRPPAPVAAPQQEEARPVAGRGNAAAAEEFNIFVRGTFSKNAKTPYFDPGMMTRANEFMGADSSAEFDWFGGPNAAASRVLGGRALLHEQVLPAFGRGEKVNMIAHSHGGNVVGEMAQYYGERMDYLSVIGEGMGAGGDKDSPAFQAAAARIAAVEKARLAELDGFRIKRDNPRKGDEPEFWPGRQGQVSQLRGELAELQRHRAGLTTGEGQEGVAAELKLLTEGDFGELMNIDTPYFPRHDEAVEQKPFMDKVDHVYDVVGEGDPVVSLAHSVDFGKGPRTMPAHEKRTQIDWKLNKDEGPKAPKWALGPEANTDRGKAKHSFPLYSAANFDNKIANKIDDVRHPRK